MHLYDVSLTFETGMPVWPGDPNLILERVSKIEAGDDVNMSQLSMSVHTGTHVDAPFHFLANGKTVDQLSLSDLTGRAYVLYLPDAATITADQLRRAEIPPRTRRILFKTRNSNYWAQKTPGFQTDFVALSVDAAEYLVERGFRLVGVDYLSVAPYDDSIPTHQVLLKAGVILVEGLNLAAIPPGRYTIYCLPLKLAGVDGSPARVILIGV